MARSSRERLLKPLPAHSPCLQLPPPHQAPHSGTPAASCQSWCWCRRQTHRSMSFGKQSRRTLRIKQNHLRPCSPSNLPLSQQDTCTSTTSWKAGPCIASGCMQLLAPHVDRAAARDKSSAAEDNAETERCDGRLTTVEIITEGIGAEGVEDRPTLCGPPSALEEAGSLAADGDRGGICRAHRPTGAAATAHSQL